MIKNGLVTCMYLHVHVYTTKPRPHAPSVFTEDITVDDPYSRVFTHSQRLFCHLVCILGRGEGS